MISKTNTATHIRRQIIVLERQLEEIAKVSSPEKALRLRQAADLLTEARAVELLRLQNTTIVAGARVITGRLSFD